VGLGLLEVLTIGVVVPFAQRVGLSQRLPDSIYWTKPIGLIRMWMTSSVLIVDAGLGAGELSAMSLAVVFTDGLAQKIVPYAVLLPLALLA